MPWPKTSVTIDPTLRDVLSALPARERPPLSALTRAGARQWLAERGIPCPPESPGSSHEERSRLGVEARERNRQEVEKDPLT